MHEIFFKTECLTRYTLSRLLKKVHERELPYFLLKFIITTFEKIYNVNHPEFEEREFKSFSDYFTRELKDLKKQRPIGHGLISPVDATSFKTQYFEESKEIIVKSTATTLQDFTGFDLQDLDFFAIHFYLSPKDYHRVHCPLESVTITDATYIEGHRLMIEKLDATFLTQNERACFKLKNQDDITFYLVMTGAFCVGNIYFAPTRSILNQTNIKDVIGHNFKLFDEIGRFAFGSSISLILPNQFFRSSNVTDNKGSIYLGETIGDIL